MQARQLVALLAALTGSLGEPSQAICAMGERANPPTTQTPVDRLQPSCCGTRPSHHVVLSVAFYGRRRAPEVEAVAPQPVQGLRSDAQKIVPAPPAVVLRI
jgi:hypothetical protein